MAAYPMASRLKIVNFIDHHCEIHPGIQMLSRTAIAKPSDTCVGSTKRNEKTEKSRALKERAFKAPKRSQAWPHPVA
jgi:hypothetical protein